MGSHHPDRTSVAAEPNVTPMIDVLLVLLIIFMAAVPAMRRGLDGQLPAEAHYGGGAPIVLEVGPGGRYALNRSRAHRAARAVRLAPDRERIDARLRASPLVVRYAWTRPPGG